MADFFILDLVTERQLNLTFPNSSLLMSKQQMQWLKVLPILSFLLLFLRHSLKDSLSASRATFKIVVGSVPLSNLTALLGVAGLSSFLNTSTLSNPAALVTSLVPPSTVIIQDNVTLPNSTLTITVPRPITLQDVEIILNVTHLQLITVRPRLHPS